MGFRPAAASLAFLLCGCPAGAYSFDGVAYRTITAPAAAVKSAPLAAIDRMGIELSSLSSYERGETIAARADERDIFIDIEPVSRKATRIRIAARTGGFFNDTATASEIILQTEKILDAVATLRVIPEAKAVAGASAAPVETGNLTPVETRSVMAE